MAAADKEEGEGLYTAVGVPGYRYWAAGGYGPRTGAVDEEWHQQLRGKPGVRFYREMLDEDVTIGSALFLVESVLRRVPWGAKAASANPVALAAAEFVDGAFADMDATWTDTMSEILSFLGFGWALCEVTWKQRMGKKPAPGAAASKFDDGRVGWASIELRAQETLDYWEFDPRGVPLGMWQRAAPDFIPRLIPMEKAILFRTKSNKGSPEGRSLLRNGRRSYFFVKRLEEFELIGIEKDQTGTLVIRLPQAYLDKRASSDKVELRADYERIARGSKRNEFSGFLFPASKDPTTGQETGFALEQLGRSGQPTDPGPAITRHRQDLAMLLLTQFQRMGMDRGGARAASNDQADMLQLALVSIADLIQQQVSPAVDELQAMNGIPQEHRATWCHGDIDRVDLGRFAEALAKVITAGAITPDTPLEDHVRDVFDLPPREDAHAGDVDHGDALPPPAGDAVARENSPLGGPGPSPDPREPPTAKV